MFNPLVDELLEARERRYREIISENDWDVFPVIRIIESKPQIFGMDRILEETIEVERYDDSAPPLRHHNEDGRDVRVATLTRPLLERLAEDYDDIDQLLE